METLPFTPEQNEGLLIVLPTPTLMPPPLVLHIEKKSFSVYTNNQNMEHFEFNIAKNVLKGAEVFEAYHFCHAKSFSYILRRF